MTLPAEAVTTTRAVHAERIPDGLPIELPAGTAAKITQALGSSFTLYVHGQLMRLRGSDADAIGRPQPDALVVDANATSQQDVEALVWQVLRTCYDPEIPVDVVELGLVYICDVEPMDDGRMRVAIQMTLTAPGCGMGDAIAEEVCDKVMGLPQVGAATVDLVFDPPWDRSRMSEAALLTLGM